MKVRRRDLAPTEIQMGPMIDMVFLLLVFFMVTARPMKPEADIDLALPGTVSQEESLEMPDEQRLQIEAGGRIILNEMVVGQAADRELASLHVTLNRFRESAAANRSEPLLTIDADDTAPHQRLIDVLNVCAKAGIHGVTFADANPEEAP